MDNESNEIGKFNKEDAEIGIFGDPPSVLLVTLPIGKYAEDMKNGNALLYGHLREAQAHAMKVLMDLRKRKAALLGLIQPINPRLNGNVEFHKA